MSKKIKILIVDDHTIISEALASLLSTVEEFDVVGTISESKNVARCVLMLQPDLVLLDFNMPGMNGLDVTHQLLASFPKIKILILSIYNEQRHVSDFRKAGAKGYLLKSADKLLLTEAIKSVYRGETVFEQEDRHKDKHDIHAGDDFLKILRITKRQKEVISKIADGLSNQGIADALFISVHTVETQKKEIFRKFGVKSSLELINLLRKLGLID